MPRLVFGAGCHIDGYIAVVASTIVVGEPVTDRKADVIAAAQTAAECVLKMLKPGQVNEEITRIIQKVADIYGCQPIEGVLSHEMKRFVIDGNKVLESIALTPLRSLYQDTDLCGST
jgi:methionine aminopeptidase